MTCNERNWPRELVLPVVAWQVEGGALRRQG